MAATSTWSAFCAAKAPFPSQHAAPYAVGFQMSKSQERPPGAEQIANAVAKPLPDADFQVGVRRRGQREIRPAQRSRTLSFARWQIFHEEFLLMSCVVAGSRRGWNLRSRNRFQDGRLVRPMAVRLAHNESRTQTALRA